MRVARPISNIRNFDLRPEIFNCKLYIGVLKTKSILLIRKQGDAWWPSCQRVAIVIQK